VHAEQIVREVFLSLSFVLTKLKSLQQQFYLKACLSDYLPQAKRI